MPLLVTYYGPLPRDVQGALVEALPEEAEGEAGDLVTVTDDVYVIPASGLYLLEADGAQVVRCSKATGEDAIEDSTGGRTFPDGYRETRHFTEGSTLAADAAT